PPLAWPGDIRRLTARGRDASEAPPPYQRKDKGSAPCTATRAGFAGFRRTGRLSPGGEAGGVNRVPGPAVHRLSQIRKYSPKELRKGHDAPRAGSAAAVYFSRLGQDGDGRVGVGQARGVVGLLEARTHLDDEAPLLVACRQSRHCAS